MIFLEKQKIDFKIYSIGGILKKLQIKQFCQQYTQNITKELNNFMKALEAEITKLQSSADSMVNQNYTTVISNRKNPASRPAGVENTMNSDSFWFLSIEQYFF